MPLSKVRPRPPQQRPGPAAVAQAQRQLAHGVEQRWRVGVGLAEHDSGEAAASGVAALAGGVHVEGGSGDRGWGQSEARADVLALREAALCSQQVFFLKKI